MRKLGRHEAPFTKPTVRDRLARMRGRCIVLWRTAFYPMPGQLSYKGDTEKLPGVCSKRAKNRQIGWISDENN